MHQSLKPLDTTVICFLKKKEVFFKKASGVWLTLPPLGLRLGLKGGRWWQVKGYCHFKKPADWSVNMEKPGADSFKLCEILTSRPIIKIRKSKQRFTPINTPFIYFLQKYTEKIIKRFISLVFVVFLKVSKVYI